MACSDAPGPRMMAAGSPGMSATITKTMSVTKKTTGMACRMRRMRKLTMGTMPLFAVWMGAAPWSRCRHHRSKRYRTRRQLQDRRYPLIVLRRGQPNASEVLRVAWIGSEALHPAADAVQDGLKREKDARHVVQPELLRPDVGCAPLGRVKDSIGCRQELRPLRA